MSDALARADRLERALPRMMRNVFTRPDPLVDMPLGQVRVLRVIEQNGQLRVGELADIMGLTPSAASQHVHRLCKMGLLDREETEADARCRLVGLSDQGRALFDEVHSCRVQQIMDVLDRLEPDHAERFVASIEEFVDQIVPATPDKP